MTNAKLKDLIKTGLELNTLNEVETRIEDIYNSCTTHAHDTIIEGSNMDELLMLQIDLETEV